MPCTCLGANIKTIRALRRRPEHMGGRLMGCAPQTMPEAIAKWRRQEQDGRRRRASGRNQVVSEASRLSTTYDSADDKHVHLLGALRRRPTKPHGRHAGGIDDSYSASCNIYRSTPYHLISTVAARSYHPRARYVKRNPPCAPAKAAGGRAARWSAGARRSTPSAAT